MITHRSTYSSILFSTLLISIGILWTFLGVRHFALNADVSRDLGELSNVWIGQIVWLGPQLRVGFPVSPLYFYLLFPGLLVSNGSAYSLVGTQVMIALAALIFWWRFTKVQDRPWVWLTLLFFALASWWTRSVINPWNGNMYVLWVVLSLVFWWFHRYWILALLFYGIAVAIHPAALLILPLILYELWHFPTVKWYLKTIGLFGFMVLPWSPIIAFEFLTKGFLTRQWLQQRSTGMSWQVQNGNWQSFLDLFDLPFFVTLSLVVASLLLAKKRARWWYLCLLPALVFLGVVSTLHQYYLLALVAVVFFLLAQTLSSNRYGRVLLGVAVILFGQTIVRTYTFDFPPPPRNRLEKIEQTVDSLITQGTITAGPTYAVISVIDEQNSTPQADDYRFLLRTKGIAAASISEYPLADELFIFIETDEENPTQWRDWHSDYFGNKELLKVWDLNDTQVVQYRRP